MAGSAGLIAVDWGTSSFRAYLLAPDGTILERQATNEGILAAAARGFPETLAAAVAPWLGAHGSVPVLMSGMIGSRQGWLETPYLECPADTASLASRLNRVEADGLPQVLIVPGLATRDADGMPDVMRGEETQVLGAMTAMGPAIGQSRGLLVLPGTHSKWVRIQDGRIQDFATYMTGEVFSALKDHTILGRLIGREASDPAELAAMEASGFELGVTTASLDNGPPGRLLHRIFSARTLALSDRMAPQQVAGYLSGLLIGSEIAAAAPAGSAVTIIANAALGALYASAATQLGISVRTAPVDCVTAGHVALARAANLLEEPRRARP